MYLNYFGTLQTVSWETNIAENVLVSPQTEVARLNGPQKR
jgi:hypothetical protein